MGGSSITVTLDSGSTATAVLTADANGTSLSGTYTVASGHSSSDLTVSSFVISSTAPVTDIYGNVATSTTVPSSPNNLADSAALDVDGAPPTSTITAAAYNDTANTITLTGTNFDTIDGGSGGADIKTQLDWTKFTWDIDGDSSATGGTFVVGDIDSAVVTSATVLTITLDTTGIAKLEGSAGEGVAGFAASSVGATYPDPDNIDILAGFISDDAGNAATTDAATDVAPSYADSAAPTISSFTSTTADGSKGVGDTIDIVATMSEAVVKGSSITVTLNSSSTATAVLTAAANGTTMTGTYTVRSGDSNPDLSVASFVQTSPVTDIYGNVMTSSSLPSTNIADGSALDVDGAPPTSTITAAAYNDTANTITLTGTNFDTIDGGSGGADIKAQLDWTKFTWDIDGDSTATGGTFVVGDIAFSGCNQRHCFNDYA